MYLLKFNFLLIDRYVFWVYLIVKLSIFYIYYLFFLGYGLFGYFLYSRYTDRKIRSGFKGIDL